MNLFILYLALITSFPWKRMERQKFDEVSLKDDWRQACYW